MKGLSGSASYVGRRASLSVKMSISTSACCSSTRLAAGLRRGVDGTAGVGAAALRTPNNPPLLDDDAVVGGASNSACAARSPGRRFFDGVFAGVGRPGAATAGRAALPFLFTLLLATSSSTAFRDLRSFVCFGDGVVWASGEEGGGERVAVVTAGEEEGSLEASFRMRSERRAGEYSSNVGAWRGAGGGVEWRRRRGGVSIDWWWWLEVSEAGCCLLLLLWMYAIPSVPNPLVESRVE